MLMLKDKQQEIQSINFQIKTVDLIKCNFIIPENQINSTQNFNFVINLEQKLNHSDKCIIVITNVDISTLEEKEVTLGSASVACQFEILNFDEIVTFDKNKHAHLNDITANVLNSIAISTTRGVISQIFRGTILHHAILPIVDPKEFKIAKLNE